MHSRPVAAEAAHCRIVPTNPPSTGTKPVSSKTLGFAFPHPSNEPYGRNPTDTLSRVLALPLAPVGVQVRAEIRLLEQCRWTESTAIQSEPEQAAA